MREGYIETATIGVGYLEQGEGPLVLLLHGFPEFSYGWRRQIPAIAAAGFRALAPDLRGYNRSERPPGVTAYRMKALVDDVVALVAALGEKDAVLVGHDWGGVVSWYAAMRHPAIVRRLVVLNAPHPAAYRRELRRFSSQLWRSWYAGFFQLPRLPEALLRAGDFAILRRALAAGPAPTPAEIDAYLTALARPGALTAALDYYRAAGRGGLPRAHPIPVPTLLIWGERDRYLVPELTEGLESWVPDLRVERLPHATHWLHHEEPETINELITGFA